MVDLPALVSEHFGSCHFEKKKGKEKEEVGIDLQEDGHLSVCTLVLKLEGERKKKKKSRTQRLPRSTKLEEDVRYFFPEDTPASAAAVERAICRFRKIMLFIVAYACALYRLLTERLGFKATPPQLLCQSLIINNVFLEERL